MPMIYGLVPVKKLAKVKNRMDGFLSLPERQALSLAMLEDVLTVLSTSRVLHRVTVVTSDPQASDLAGEKGAEVIAESEGIDSESQAVDYGASVLSQRGVESILVIPLDVPLVTSTDIEKLVAERSMAPSVVMAPSKDGGTNALLKTPPDVIPSRFGYDSLRLHQQEAEKRGVKYKVLTLPSLVLDIDSPEDLICFASQSTSTHTHKAIIEMGLMERLRQKR